MSEELQSLRDLAEDAAREAGKIVMGFFRARPEVWEKSQNNPVTEADLAADKYLRERLTAELPESGWLSEETKDSPERLGKKRCWVVDPVDGTKEFIEGLDHFTVCVALVEDGKPIVSAMFNPARDEMFTAALGQGATMNGEPLKVTGRKDWSGARLSVSRSELKRGEWEPYTEQKVEGVGSIAYKMALVADGRSDATFSRGPKHEWDVCAGVLLVTEAGGWSGNLAGEEYVFNQPKPLVDGVIATTGELLKPILDSVEQHGRVRVGEKPSIV